MSSADRTQLDPQRRRIAIFANPNAGSGSRAKFVDELAAALLERGLEPAFCRQREELSDLDAGDWRCIVSVGGDGTLAEVMNRAPGVPIALLPTGTENVMARYLHLPRCAQTIATLIAAGRSRRLDLLRVNGRLCSLMASAGMDAAVVHLLHANRRGNINHLSYASPLLSSLLDYPFPLMDVRFDDAGEVVSAAYVGAFNVPRYGLDLPLARSARADDGLIDVLMLKRPGRRNLLRYMAAFLSGRQHKTAGIQHRRARKLTLSSPWRVPLQTDGDPAGMLPATIEIVPMALTLVVP